MNTAKEATLLDKALQALQAHGLTTALQNAPKALAHPHADACLRVGKDEQHIDYVVEAILQVYERRASISGYHIVSQPKFLRHFTARFEPLQPFALPSLPF